MRKTKAIPFSLRSGSICSALAALALAGCTSMAPVYERPAAPVATQWPTFGVQSQEASATPAGDLLWQDFVTDARLRTLIDKALADNRDLRVAALSIEQARAQYQIRSADQTPTINLAATGNRQPASGGGISRKSTSLAASPASRMPRWRSISPPKRPAVLCRRAWLPLSPIPG